MPIRATSRRWLILFPYVPMQFPKLSGAKSVLRSIATCRRLGVALFYIWLGGAAMYVAWTSARTFPSLGTYTANINAFQRTDGTWVVKEPSSMETIINDFLIERNYLSSYRFEQGYNGFRTIYYKNPEVNEEAEFLDVLPIDSDEKYISYLTQAGSNIEMYEARLSSDFETRIWYNVSNISLRIAEMLVVLFSGFCLYRGLLIIARDRG
ncbi:hypothetical protein LUX29_13930 [Aureimonas altamirensis]|uniref:hypothetical protein n=1 Tax=Aureimonas altamirensis TaxID=370622 RepID=UPI001E63F2AE|nr:hypothetical protein [Aureimonas altamirensis]UHD44161.1 hypothetical protein LUX29_13930 [Aureimonas altamirensis]